MTNYSTNLTDSQYGAIVQIIDGTRKRRHSSREILNVVFYLLKTGCQWHMLPGDFPKWQLVYYYFSQWNEDGTSEEIHETLRDRCRERQKKYRSPSVGADRQQSVKTTCVVGESRGGDGGEKIRGRKRHIVTDINGLLLTVEIHAANEHDDKAGFRVITFLGDRFERMKKIYADGDTGANW